MSIAAKHAAVLLGLALGATAVCCGGGLTPAEQETAAQQAMIDEDYQAALVLYQGLLDRQGVNGIPEDMRFRAALESTNCRAQLGRYDEAVGAFMRLEKDYAVEMERKGARHTLDLTRLLVRQNAPIQTTLDLLEYAGDQWPEKKARFESIAISLTARTSIPEESIPLYEQNGEPRLIDILDTPWQWEQIDGN